MSKHVWNGIETNGEFLRCAMHTKGLTTADVARLSGLDGYSVERVLRGDRGADFGMIGAVGEAVGLTPDDMPGGRAGGLGGV